LAILLWCGVFYAFSGSDDSSNPPDSQEEAKPVQQKEESVDLSRGDSRSDFKPSNEPKSESETEVTVETPEAGVLNEPPVEEPQEAQEETPREQLEAPLDNPSASESADRLLQLEEEFNALDSEPDLEEWLPKRNVARPKPVKYTPPPVKPKPSKSKHSKPTKNLWEKKRKYKPVSAPRNYRTKRKKPVWRTNSRRTNNSQNAQPYEPPQARRSQNTRWRNTDSGETFMEGMINGALGHWGDGLSSKSTGRSVAGWVVGGFLT